MLVVLKIILFLHVIHRTSTQELSSCSAWPLKQEQIITSKVFTCEGEIKGVINCDYTYMNPQMQVMIWKKHSNWTLSTIHSSTETVYYSTFSVFDSAIPYNEGDFLGYLISQTGGVTDPCQLEMVTFLIGTSRVDIREEICSNKYATALIVTDDCYSEVKTETEATNVSPSETVSAPSCSPASPETCSTINNSTNNEIIGAVKKSNNQPIGLIVAVVILVILLVVLSISCCIIWIICIKLGRVQLCVKENHYDPTDCLPLSNDNQARSTAVQSGILYSTIYESPLGNGHDGTFHREQNTTQTHENGSNRAYNNENIDSMENNYEVANEAIYWEPQNTLEGIYSQISDERFFHIKRQSISTSVLLGEGQFGLVYRGGWLHMSTTYTVAVKILKETATEDEKVKFLQEAVTMGQFDHPHIVKLFGMVTTTDPPMLIMEYLANGDLRSYLLKIRANHIAIVPLKLLQFCQQIASSMSYLSAKRFVHRDLAARNILLDDNCHCKVGDFGMSHDMQEDYYYKPKGGQIPVKWTAPEAILYQKYTTKSDVWSFGMVMFEIWSLGHKPFDDMTVEELIAIFKSGYCQPPPPGCPKKIYEIMVQCWNPDSHVRPSFHDIVNLFEGDQRELLQIDPERSGNLGEALQLTFNLYPDLQKTYFS